ncbi:MAG TPA: polysaccharide deacetylase family protein [Solirubrobacterales bacterium]|jgi:peptidoglycan/xylan/chitin deacetylase (PgdA/CDA1 family)|nr:polysaccharide deacetylase family protein [Solirubrobacterales bacterium]
MGDVLVLCYHGISETWPAATSVRPGDFEDQLRAFVRRGYRGATLAEALTAPPAERTLVVSFDDANRSVLELAAPIMAGLGMPGTVFVPTDYAGSGEPMGWEGHQDWLGTEHERELLCLGWEQLRGLVGEGWEVGSHTCSHPRLSRLDDAAISRELSESKRVCEAELGVPCRSLAYPYSDYDERAVKAAAEAGYGFAVTVPRRPQSPLPLQWPRVGVFHGESANRVALRARSRRFAPSAAMRAALALRRLAG